jgi:hypothetical protein
MNQTKKRLKIIKLAIAITDIETIQLQILKLIPLKTDEKIQEIIAGLQAENYAQTQALITTYIETPMEEIVQRTAQVARKLKKAEERDIIEEFDLFVTTSEKHEESEKNLFDLGTLEPENTPKKEQEVIDFDALLNIEADKVLAGNIELDISQKPQDTFFDKLESLSERTKETHIDTGIIPKDTFFDTEESPVTQKKEVKTDLLFEETTVPTEESLKKIHIDTNTIPKDTFFDTKETSTIQEISEEETDTDQLEEETIVPSHKSDEESIQEKPTITPSEEKILSEHQAIPYINQKFKNLQTQYPLVEENDEKFSSVNAWLQKITHEGYTNNEVEEIIRHITKLIEANNFAEAAQLLLISGATKSKYAQFILARALYKGEILQKNLPESFTLINRLALDDNYPEAICDLGQFYENGIGIGKDKKRAEELYKESMELGIHRAIRHYERIRKQNRSFFSAFKK